ASAGVGTLGILDDDVVDATNLQRQIAFGTTDVGRPKAAVAAERVRELSPHTTVVEIREYLDAANAAPLLTGYDIVVDGSDTFETRYAVADACAALGIPLVWGSVLRFDAQATVFWSRPPTGTTTASDTTAPGMNAAGTTTALGMNAAGTTTGPGMSPVAPVNLRDVFPDPPAPEDAPSCADAGVLGALCGQLGGILSAEVVKLVCGVGRTLLGRMLVIDALTATTSEVPLVPSRAHAGNSIPRPLAEASRPDAVRRVSVAELSDLSDPAIIDVREPDEFAAGSIPGARSVPLAHLTTDAPLLPLDRPVVVFCQTGPRARIAARTLLAEHPDADIRILDGGYDAWMRVHRRVRA
ncbi:ThiF family adenylyltransferase, partial [Humibacter sp.]|uniref:ThiF family adenylyltransferase n=1 Tax=Humibacter sp. TaxID=1940291 RepID=UPI003F81F45F